MQIICKTDEEFFMWLIFKMMVPPLRLDKSLASNGTLKSQAAAIQNQVQIKNSIFFFNLNKCSVSYLCLIAAGTAAHRHIFPQRPNEMSVRSVAESQTELYDQKASATEHWLLGNGLNSREIGEKPTAEQKATLFPPVSSLSNTLRGFKQALCDKD